MPDSPEYPELEPKDLRDRLKVLVERPEYWGPLQQQVREWYEGVKEQLVDASDNEYRELQGKAKAFRHLLYLSRSLRSDKIIEKIRKSQDGEK